VIVIIALASGGGASTSETTSTAAGSSGAPAKPDARSTTAAYRRESRAITRVLGYTPFVARGSPRKRDVALTIDDGPGPLTPQFVRTLRRLHAPATFFIVGQQLNSFGAGLREEIRAGFAIGDHTEQHQTLTQLRPGLQNKAIQDAALRIRSYGVPYPRLFRPPGGLFNPATIAALRDHRMLAVLWTVDTKDFTRPGTKAIVQRTVDGARNGAIILLHDGGGDRSQTLAALPAIIHRLRTRGFQLVTVPQMLLHDPPSKQQARPISHGA
jgi:peptidoglycan-N-acetylglucosamine deacetylase